MKACTITKLEIQLNNIYEQKTKGAQIRSKINWLENDENNMKYFLGLEKSKQGKQVIHNITVSEQKITDDKNILNNKHEFYSNLYQSD